MKSRYSKEEFDQAIIKCAKRISGPKDRIFIQKYLNMLVKNNSIPLELLDHIPVPPQESGKTRIDQLFDAAMQLVFPGYRDNTMNRLLGPDHSENIKIWRIIFPMRFRISHVLLRAETYQEAFAKACDYGCRLSLHLFGKIPVDLSIRVMFMSEAALRRHLALREVNRKRKGALRLQLQNRKMTPRQISGARIAALGPPTGPDHQIFRYVEKKDLRRVREGTGRARLSSVESESFRKPKLEV